MNIMGTTKVHINTCAPLEYRIPEIGRVVKDVILGRVPKKDAAHCIRCCFDKLGDHSVLETGAGRKSEDRCETLHKCSCNVCSLFEAYLQDISTEWKVHLRNISSSARMEACRLRGELATTAAAHRNETCRTAIDRELQVEANRLREELESFIASARLRGEPRSLRPIDLEENCLRLKNAFAHSNLPERTLLCAKYKFEKKMLFLQKRIAKDFVDAVQSLL